VSQSILVWLLLEDDGAVLLGRRGDRGRFAGQWQLPGDAVADEESAEEALRRFASSELGVRVGREEFAETLYLTDGPVNCVTNVFRVHGLDGEPRFRAGGPYAEMRWVDPALLGDPEAYPMPLLLQTWLSGRSSGALQDRRSGVGVPDNKAAWNQISAAYQAEHRLSTDAAHYGPRMPTEADLRLLGDVEGKCILEIGCGGGLCSIAFAKEGAIATGIDFSSAQIAFARDLAAREGVAVDFQEGDITTLPGVRNASQDAVFSSYALQYVEDIETCLAEVHRVLVHDGVFVFSTDHPARQMLGEDDPLRVARAYWDGYEEFEWRPGSGIWMRAWVRTVEEWFSLLRGAGFQVDRILEPRMLPNAEDETWDDIYKYDQGRLVPTTLIIRAVKP
jgi:ubiquinone/menaquinone biosynthesis C-methylase UbiE/ADP-ribose pyrophosphatase YjhB (NUDIX family)